MSQLARPAAILVFAVLGIVRTIGTPSHRTHTAQPMAINHGQQVVLTRASDGHFWTDAQVNGQFVHFLVDTGASDVVLSREDAATVGLSVDSAAFTGSGRTAGGTVRMMPVTFDSVAIGSLEETQVDGVVIDGRAGVSLLGQSWLRRVGSVTIAQDRMTLQ